MTDRLVKTYLNKKCKNCTKKHPLTERLVKDKKRIYNFQLFNKKKYYLLTKSLAMHQRNYYVTMLMIQVAGLFGCETNCKTTFQSRLCSMLSK